MHAAMRPYATAGVALVGASVIAVTPIAPSQPDIRIVDPTVSLAAASVANIPANLINAFLNMPAAAVAGIERFAAAMEDSGSWNESHSNNVWGWDPANPEMLKGFVDMLLPFPALSGPLGEHLNWWAAANLPMYEGCAFKCPDPIGLLSTMFRVPIWEFYDEDGYTFGEVINPIDGQPTEWSGDTVKLDPFEPITSSTNYFREDPRGFQPVSAYEVITAAGNLAAALQTTGHLADWIAVREIETFLKLFVPEPETSSIPAPDSARTFTLDAAALRTDLGNEVQSRDAQQGGLPVADLANTPGSTGGDVLTTVQDDVAAGSGASGRDAATEATAPSRTAPTTRSIDLEKDGNKAAHGGRSGPEHRKPGGGLADAVTSVKDTINTSISKVTDGLKGGDTTRSGDTAKSENED